MYNSALIFFASAASLFWLAAAVNIGALLDEICSDKYLAANEQKAAKKVPMDAGEYDAVLGKAPEVEYGANCKASGKHVSKCNLIKPAKANLELFSLESSDTSVTLKKALKNRAKTCTFTCQKQAAATLNDCIA